MRRIFTARWILPITSPPIVDGWFATAGGRIADVGGGHPPSTDRHLERIDLGNVAVLPGLVNAHTHLELSDLRNLVAPATSLPQWVRRLLEVRRTPDPASIRAAIDEAVRFGTALVGDISNTLATVTPLAQSGLSAVVFKEILQFATTDAPRVVQAALSHVAAQPTSSSVRCALAAHAPYSVAPEVFRAIKAAADQAQMPMAVHLSESREELVFLSTGGGAWRDLLHELHAWNPSWEPPGSGAVDYLDGLGILDGGLIAAHGVQLTPSELARLASARVTLVTCPRSNRWTGAGTPPVDAFYRSGVRVAVGTDSLASTPDLGLWGELAELRRIAPSIPARRFLRSATHTGAEALGFGADFGAIAPGRRAALIAVDVPRDTADVEEYLVGGIGDDQIRWVVS